MASSDEKSMLKEKKEENKNFQTLLVLFQICLLNSNIKTIESFDGTHIQYDSDGDVYFKALVVVEYLSEMKTHFTDIIE